MEVGLRPSLMNDEARLESDEIHLNKIITTEEEDVAITNIEMVNEDSVDIDLDKTKTIYYYQNMLVNTIALSKTNPSSKVTYKITMHNYTDIEQTFINLGTSLFDQNKNITYTITGLSAGDKIQKDETITFYVSFYYLNNKIPNQDNPNYIEDYNILDIGMKFNFGLSKTEIVSTSTYSIYDKEQRIPVVINNNNDYDISGKILYNGIAVGDEISIPANKINNIIPVDISSIYDNLEEKVEYSLDFELSSPYTELYSNAVTFRKEKSSVSITKIETYINNALVENDTISYTENSIAVDNSVDNKNSLITYKITVRNNATDFGYKFRNITDVFNSNSSLGYTTSLDLASSVIIRKQQELTFDINYQYDEKSTNNIHKQILQFEFKSEFVFEGATENMISFSYRENSTSLNYGDFGVIRTDFSSPTMSCTYDECYSDNNGDLVYNEDGGLVLDDNNAIATLNIDQSMSVADEYSVYFTVKGDTNQGLEEKFPSTIVAISEDSGKYLTWVGFYQNYLHVYSYYNGGSRSGINYYLLLDGFISFDISEYSNQIINIQIVATRGEKTKIYINGDLKQSINSGVNEVSFTYATIGDLRPGRNLKFQGILYDMGVYNRALLEDEVQLNWEHANSVWKIEQ